MSVPALHADQLTQGETRWSISLSSSRPNPSLVSALARSFLAGELTVDGLVARGGWTLGRPWRWLRPVAQRYVEFHGSRPRLTHCEVVQFLLHDASFQRAWKKRFDQLRVAAWMADAQSMQPVGAAKAWNLPAISTIGDLADWFNLRPEELHWFADLKAINAKQPATRLRHYNYRALAKASGHVRLIEAPKQHLKLLQRQMLTSILDLIPPHEAVHGFVKGRSIKTFASMHVGGRVVLRMDLKDFFPSIGRARIQALFRTAGYPEPVANLLGGLCTHLTSPDLWRSDLWRQLAPGINAAELRAARQLYSRPHLPQGAPTSPALANLCAYHVDCRLTGLAQAAGGVYSRYADDLAFSGDEAFDRCVERFSTYSAAVLLEEGFEVNHRKTRIMRQGVRQHLTGLVTNERLNVTRNDFDRLKAILTNCVRHGPQNQNRENHPAFKSHLEGRAAFIESINPQKGARLRKVLNRITWGESAAES